jgi:hypothetical protein
MINTCPKCSAKMIETTGPSIKLSHPPQYEVVMWCGCGYSESRGWKRAYTTEEIKMYQWKKLNTIVQSI